MARKLAPLNDIVLLKRQEKNETTAGGILLPGNSGETPNIGGVVAVGPGRMNEHGVRQAMDVKVGDVVMFDLNYARDVKVDGEELTIIAAENLIAIVEE